MKKIKLLMLMYMLGIVSNIYAQTNPKTDYTYTFTGTNFNQAVMDEIETNAKAVSGIDPENYTVAVVFPAGNVVNMIEENSSVVVPAGMSVYFFGNEGSTKATINLPRILNVKGKHTTISFENVNLIEPDASNSSYVINQPDAASSCNISTLRFASCFISNFGRGLVRHRYGNIDNIEISDCIVTGTNDYSLIQQEAAGFGTIEIDGSTFYNISTNLIVDKTPSNDLESISITNSTFYNCFMTGKYWIDLKNKNTAKAEVVIDKVLVGHLNPVTSEDRAGNGIRAQASKVTVNNLYETNDVKWGGASDYVKKFAPGVTFLEWNSDELFANPAENDFTLKHNLDAGDPRWQGQVPYSFHVKNDDGINLYYYRTEESKVMLVNRRPVKYAGDVVIPASVTYKGITYDVTAIGEQAFSNCSVLTSVTIPNSVTSIGEKAFFDCSGLTSITIPESVTSIGSNAFSGTAWYYNQPDGLVYAGKFAYKYKGTMPSGTSIEIKEGTLGIAEEAFYGCLGLTSVTIPESVTTIGYYAFEGCSGLTKVTFHCKKIGTWFGGIYSIKEIVIGEEVTIIGNYAFEGCSGLTSVTIPNSVTTIDHKAFAYCSGLTSITIPESVTSIGSSAFEGCYSLTSITIPNSVTRIDSYVFSDCSDLTSITIPNSVTSIGIGAFQNCTGLTSVTIPNSVTTIGKQAFSTCSGLTSITIPESVKWIASSAFEGCSNLNEVYNEALTPQILTDDPKFNYTAATLHVPAGTKELYQATDYWKDFSNIVEDLNTVTVEDDKEPATTVGGEEFYNLALDKETVKYAEIISVNEAGKGRIAIKDGGLQIVEGDDVRFALSEIKKGDILVFDFVGKIRCLYGTLTANAAQQNSFQQVTSDEMELESGKEYIANDDCDVVLEMETTEAPVELKSITITEPTGVNIVETSTSNPSSCKTYNLAGQQVKANSNGLLIQGGKKIIKH